MTDHADGTSDGTIDAAIDAAGDAAIDAAGDGTTSMRQRLRAALTTAMKARDQVRVRALRDGLGAIDNAEAVAPVDGEMASLQQSGGIAGARSGLGAADVARRTLSADRVRDVIGAQIDERLAAAEEFDRAGAPERAAQLRDEADVLRAFLES